MTCIAIWIIREYARRNEFVHSGVKDKVYNGDIAGLRSAFDVAENSLSHDAVDNKCRNGWRIIIRYLRRMYVKEDGALTPYGAEVQKRDRAQSRDALADSSNTKRTVTFSPDSSPQTKRRKVAALEHHVAELIGNLEEKDEAAALDFRLASAGTRMSQLNNLGATLEEPVALGPRHDKKSSRKSRRSSKPLERVEEEEIFEGFGDFFNA